MNRRGTKKANTAKLLMALAVLAMMAAAFIVTGPLTEDSDADTGYIIEGSGSDKKLTITGTGAMDNYGSGKAPWYSERSNITSIVIEQGVTSIGDYAFQNLAKVTSIQLPVSVTSIGSYTFVDCSGLTTITVNGDLTSINGLAFKGCTSLNSLIFTVDQTKYEIKDGILYTDDGKTLVRNINAEGQIIILDEVTSIQGAAFSGTKVTEVQIPEGITTLSDALFYKCNLLTTVETGSMITSIGNATFSYCSNLTDEGLPDLSSVTEIKGSAFSDCVLLTEIEAGSFKGTLGSNAFDGCTLLERVTFGTGDNGFTGIGISAFRNCKALTTLPDMSKVTSIGNNAFQNCSLITVIDAPACKGTIGVQAFDGCSSLTSVTLNTEENAITGIGNYAFRNCKALTTLPDMSKVTSIGNYAFQNCVLITSIDAGSFNGKLGNYAFDGCTLLESVEFGSFTGIGTYAFRNCKALTDLPDDMSKVTSIGEYAFQNCVSLDSIVLPSGVTVINQFTFFGCKTLSSITCSSPMTSISGSAFIDCGSLRTITLSGDEVTYKISDNYLMTEDGSKIIRCLDFSSYPSIPSTVQELDSGAYSGLPVKSMSIPSRITAIGSYLFYDCTELSFASLPSSIIALPDYIFANCASLETVSLSSYLTTIGQYSFQNCVLLNSFIIPDSVTAIGRNAFYGCINLTGELNIPSNLSRIEQSTFQFTSYRSISWGSNLTYIGSSAFQDCPWLEEFNMPEGVTEIGSNIITNCRGITHMSIPSSYEKSTSLGFNISGLESITVASGNTVYKVIDDALVYLPTNTMYCYPMGKSVAGSVEDGQIVGGYKIPSEVETLRGGTAFRFGGVGIPLVEIPGTVKLVPASAFQSTHIRTIVIDADFTGTIEPNAFSNCRTLLEVYDLRPEGQRLTLDSDVFNGCENLQAIHDSLDDESLVTTQNGFNLAELTNDEDEKAWYIVGMTFSTRNLVIDGSSFSDIGAVYPNIALRAFEMQRYETITISNIDHIADYAFCEERWASSISISNVESIGFKAFNWPHSLESLTLSGVGEIGDYAFSIYDDYKADPHKSITELTIPSTVTKIGEKAFAYHDRLTDVTIEPATWDADSPIGPSVFIGCSSLKNINLGNIPVISEGMFLNCEALDYIVIPAEVTSVGADAFKGCTSLGTIVMAYSGESPLNIVPGDGSFDTGNTETTVCYSTQVFAPSTIDDDNMFISSIRGNTNVYVVQGLPIAESSLLYLYDSVTETLSVFGYGDLPDYTSEATPFWSSITGDIVKLILKEGVTSVGSYNFRSLTTLQEITLPSTIEDVAAYSFGGDSSIRKIDASTMVNITGASRSDDMFKTDSGASPSIVLRSGGADYNPSEIAGTTWFLSPTPGILYMGSGPTKDVEFTYDTTNGNNVLTVYGIGNMDDYTTTAGGRAPWYEYMDSIKSVVVQPGVVNVGGYAFDQTEQASTALASVSLNASITSLGDYAFCGCSELEGVTLPDSLTFIGAHAFEGCKDSSFTAISIPSGVKSIGASAFEGCNNLVTMTLLMASAPTMGAQCLNVGDGNDTSVSLTLKAMLWLKSADQSWYTDGETFIIIERIGDDPCGPTMYYYIDNGTLYIVGSGDMFDYDHAGTASPWSDKSIHTVIIDGDVTHIGTDAFYGMSTIRFITLSAAFVAPVKYMDSSKVTIGANAFEGCGPLQYVYAVTDSSDTISLKTNSTTSYPFQQIGNMLTVAGALWYDAQGNWVTGFVSDVVYHPDSWSTQVSESMPYKATCTVTLS